MKLIWLCLGIILIILGLWLIPVVVLAAAPGDVVFAEDFSIDLRQWQVTRGSSTIWQIVDGVLEGNLLTTSTLSELIPKPEFWQNDWRNYRFELDIQPIAGVDRNLAWGYQDPLNWYEIHFLPDFFQLAKLRNGQLAWGESGDFNRLTPGSWHHLRLDTAGGQIQIWLDGFEVAKVTDQMYQENLGTIAIKIGSGSIAPVKMRFDNLKVTILADPREIDLVVPEIRQDDAIWANELYDSAQDWAGAEAKTISRWGCALTSAVMILKHYGFNQLTASQALTPASLNIWLKSQPDGYLDQGWINWLAVARLTRELQPVWSTLIKPLPQLKYSYRSWKDWLSEGQIIIKQELSKQYPVILELPGHFVVAKGLIKSGLDILINDPAKLGFSLNDLILTPKSGRFWQPSYDPVVTSARYWLVKLPRGLRIRVFNDVGELIPSDWLSQDAPGLKLETDISTTDSVMVWDNPPIGGFNLEIDRATGDVLQDGGLFPTAILPRWMPIDLDFWIYDDQTRPSKINLVTDLGPDHALWWIETSLTEPPVFFSAMHWIEWRRVGKVLFDEGLIPAITWARANYLAELADLMINFASSEFSDQFSNQFDNRYFKWLTQILSLAETEAMTKNQLETQKALVHWRGILDSRWGPTNIVDTL